MSWPTALLPGTPQPTVETWSFVPTDLLARGSGAYEEHRWHRPPWARLVRLWVQGAGGGGYGVGGGLGGGGGAFSDALLLGSLAPSVLVVRVGIGGTGGTGGGGGQNGGTSSVLTETGVVLVSATGGLGVNSGSAPAASVGVYPGATLWGTPQGIAGSAGSQGAYDDYGIVSFAPSYPMRIGGIGTAISGHSRPVLALNSAVQPGPRADGVLQSEGYHDGHPSKFGLSPVAGGAGGSGPGGTYGGPPMDGAMGSGGAGATGIPTTPPDYGDGGHGGHGIVVIAAFA